jgi:hypothetical protein
LLPISLAGSASRDAADEVGAGAAGSTAATCDGGTGLVAGLDVAVRPAVSGAEIAATFGGDVAAFMAVRGGVLAIGGAGAGVFAAVAGADDDGFVEASAA